MKTGHAGLLLLLAVGPAASAAPDFTASEIRVSSDSPREGDIVVFSVILRNTGADEAGSVYFTAEWPVMGFLVDAQGFDGAEVDHEARRISLTVPLPVGAERRFDLRVLAPRDSGGDALTLAIRASHFASQTEHWDRKTITIDTRLGSGGVAVGGLRITPAGVVTLSVLGVGALLWLVLRGLATRGSRRSRQDGSRFLGPGTVALALTIPLGFWTMFGALAWRDYQSLTTWPETTCTILGGRLSAQTTTRTRRGATSAYVDDTNYVPVLGLKYLVDGRETYSSGYDTGSRLGVGGRGGRTEELAQWTIGGTTPCWYNPSDATDVVVLPGFGGAYIFALFPLPVFLFGVARIRSLLVD